LGDGAAKTRAVSDHEREMKGADARQAGDGRAKRRARRARVSCEAGG
jgi:hypothetical protein